MKTKITWLIYIILIVFIVLYFVKIKPQHQEEINAESPFGLYKDMIFMIRKDNYKFDYTITKDNEQIKYYGKKDKENESSSFIVNFEKKDKTELSNYINPNILNINYLFDILDKEKAEPERQQNIRVYNYYIKIDEVSYNVKVTTDVDSISEIDIINENEKYILIFNDIGFTTI